MAQLRGLKQQGRRAHIRGGASSVKAAEIALAAPAVIALRTARMLANGLQPTAHDRREASRMVVEKVAAWQESVFEMAAHVLKAQAQWQLGAWRLWWTWSTRPWPLLGAGRALYGNWQRAIAQTVDKGVAPVHRRVTANARRMRRPGRRKR